MNCQPSFVSFSTFHIEYTHRIKTFSTHHRHSSLKGTTEKRHNYMNLGNHKLKLELNETKTAYVKVSILVTDYPIPKPANRVRVKEILNI